MKAWSYSALTSFETCPRRHYETKVAKRFKETEGEALLWGNEVHKALEKRALEDKPLPTGMTQWEPMMKRLLEVDGELLAESQFAITANNEPTEWFAKNVRLRCVIDFGKRAGGKILALDYKTGKLKHDIDQLQLFAATLMEVYKDVEKVVSGYLWLKEKKVTKETYTRDQLPRIWGRFAPRVARLDQAHVDDVWPENPSGLCRNYCPVTSCKYHGR